MSFQKWLDGPYDPQTKEEILRLLETDPEGLKDAFYRSLAFGTGGMRGIMGVGTNRINVYTIRMATQGLANYLLKRKGKRVFIGYDVRRFSRLFAEETARTLAGNGIEALITKDICPTPLASFGCRHFGCAGAVMITASHNPPEYNGYKVYGEDGAQIVFPDDEEIIAEVNEIQNPEEIKLAPIDHPLIRWIGSEIDDLYLQELHKLQGSRTQKSLSIVYTNLHGTGLRLVPKALESWGFPSPKQVEAQTPYDGAFPAAPSPNPEELAALELGTRQLLEEKADILLATDPDADRIGLVVQKDGRAAAFNGNEIACVCLDHLIKKGNLPSGARILKTIVTTELVRKIADNASIACVDVLTGFKYIAKEIRNWEEKGEGHRFLFGAEESHGYLAGTFVRDKDAIGASCLIAEAAERQKGDGRTLVDALYDLYRIFGVHRQRLSTLAFSNSRVGMESMQKLMETLRSTPPSSIGGRRVASFHDLLPGWGTQPKADVLLFHLEDQTKLVIRPSGTEPKIKIYLEASDPRGKDLQKSIDACDVRLKETLESFKNENGI